MLNRLNLNFIYSISALIQSSELIFFTLTNKDSVYYPHNDSGVVYLSKLGHYKLSSIYLDIDIDYEFIGYQSVIDTINTTRLQLGLEPATSHPNFIGYYCCDQKCNGMQVDYYSNGNKRIEGYFKEGIPYGELKTFYPNGQLKQLDKYNAKGRLKRRSYFNEKGEIDNIEKY